MLGSEKKGEELKIIEFLLGSQHFGIDIFQIENVINMKEITPLPQAPSFLEGMVNLRGHLIPVVNLSKKFGFISTAEEKKKKIIIIKFEGREIGIIVDEVREVLSLKEDILENPLLYNQLGIGLEYIENIAKMDGRLIIILKLDKVFSVEEKQVLNSV